MSPIVSNTADMQAIAERGITVFDFDGTITTQDTFALFLRRFRGLGYWSAKIARLLPTFVAYKLGRIDRHTVKEAVIRAFFTDVDRDEIAEKGKTFAEEVIPPLLRPKAIDAFEAAKSDLESLYICSASIAPYLKPWAEMHGLPAKQVLCVELFYESDRATGEIDGYNVWGPNKTRRIFDLFAPHSPKILAAYGDTRGDQELLHAAEASFYRPFRL